MDSNPAVTAKILDQWPHELAGNRTKLADGVSKAQHLRVDPIGQTSPLADESSPLCRQDSELLDGYAAPSNFRAKDPSSCDARVSVRRGGPSCGVSTTCPKD